MENMKDYAKEHNVPIIKDGGLTFILNLIKEHDIKNILELGTAIGYSSSQMAKISKDIHIVTLEKKTDLYNLAIQNIEDEGLSNQITCHNINIDDFNTDEKFDLIFIDAAKAQYQKYLDHFYNNINDNGFFVFDNMEFHGMVSDPTMVMGRNTRQLVSKIRRFRDNILVDDRYYHEYYPTTGDGILVLRKKV